MLESLFKFKKFKQGFQHYICLLFFGIEFFQ